MSKEEASSLLEDMGRTLASTVPKGSRHLIERDLVGLESAAQTKATLLRSPESPYFGCCGLLLLSLSFSASSARGLDNMSFWMFPPG
jgi:hypothetical protein